MALVLLIVVREASLADYREDIPYKVVKASSGEADRRSYWQTASALQATDGLKVSSYAQRAASRYVAGKIGAADLVAEVEAHYEGVRDESRQPEADIVASRITELLETPMFVLRPSTLIAIHKRLFEGVLPEGWVGQFRRENITKAEPVLGGRSVEYMDYSMIADALDYDFGCEASKAYEAPLDNMQVARFSKFIAGVWQIHAFREGNTRTMATFSELYLSSLGVRAINDAFIGNSVYYRDALVRASFSSIELGVREEPSFLTRFYENVALGAHNELDGAALNLHGVRPVDSDIRYRE